MKNKKNLKTLHLPITQPKLWILDVDGVIFIHAGHFKGRDTLVPGFMDFYAQIKPEDFIFIVTAREKKYKKITESALKEHGIRFDKIIYDVPKGERICVNDNKPDGTKACFAVNTDRDLFPYIEITT